MFAHWGYKDYTHQWISLFYSTRAYEAAPSLAALGPRYILDWTRLCSVTAFLASHCVANFGKWHSQSLFKYWTTLQVSSPQKCHRTGIDSLLRKSKPDGFTEVHMSPSSITVLTVTQPPPLDEQYENTENHLLRALDQLAS